MVKRPFVGPSPVDGVLSKWIRIGYRCVKTRTPYDEAKYLNALRKRGSPLLEILMLKQKTLDGLPRDVKRS